MNTLLEPPSRFAHLAVCFPSVNARRPIAPITVALNRPGTFVACCAAPFTPNKTAPIVRCRASHPRARQSFKLIRESK